MTRCEKELRGIERAESLFNEFLVKFIVFDGLKVTYGKTGKYPIKANIRLYNSNQKYKNRPVYKFEVGYPNITNNACLEKLLEFLHVCYSM